MSSFTVPLIVEAVPVKPSGLKRLLPPGLQRPRWEVLTGFSYAVGSLEAPTETIRVQSGFAFDGASVPFVFRLLVPMAHPNYMQAAALHDWMIERTDYRRSYIDRVFLESLKVLGMPRLWRILMYIGARIGGVLRVVRGWF